MAMTAVLRGVGVLILCLAAIAARMRAIQEFDPPPVLHSSLRSPIVAMELARSAVQVHSVLGDPQGSHNRAVMRRQIAWDWSFIAAYGLAFAGLGVVLRACRWPGARGFGALALAASGAAALFDGFENLGILAILDTPPDLLSEGLPQLVRRASLTKWGLLAAAEAAVVPLLLLRPYDRPGWPLRLLSVLAGLALSAAAVLGFIGLYWNPAIEWSAVALALGLLAASPIFLFFPRWFLLGAGVPIDALAETRGTGTVMTVDPERVPGPLHAHTGLPHAPEPNAPLDRNDEDRAAVPSPDGGD